MFQRGPKVASSRRFGVRRNLTRGGLRLSAALLALALAPESFSQASFNFNTSDEGFTVASGGPVSSVWTYSATAGVGGNGAWYVNGTGGQGVPSYSALISPTLIVSATGVATLSFNHRYSFEDNSTPWDGGQVLVSVNGGAFTAVPNSAFTANGYNGALIGHGVLENQQAFNGTSAGYATPSYITSTLSLGSYFGGDTLRVRFLGAWDEAVVGPAPNWVVDNITVSNVTVPEPTFVAGIFGIAVLGWTAGRRRRHRSP